MSFPAPFAYPTEAHKHKHAPDGYSEYQRYKPWLRDEFTFRCAYCLTRETWGSSVSGHAELGADHFEPKSVNQALVTTYSNLIYVCNDCNRYKRTLLLSIDPLNSPLADHLHVDGEGIVSASTIDGQDFIDLLDLNAPGRSALRKDRLRVLKLKQKWPDDPDVHAVFLRAFGFPADLPNLADLNPPNGNANAGSEQLSYYALRVQGRLPDVY